MNINSWEETWGPINWYKGSEEEIKQKIIDFYHAGVDFNMKDENTIGELMPLDFAARLSSVDIINLLIDGGADINLTDKHGWTPLHWAAHVGKTQNVKYLIEHGPRNFVNKQEEGGWTALHLAARTMHAETAKALIEEGADINIKTKAGLMDDAYTVLDIADKWGYTNVKEIVQNAAQIRSDYLNTHSEDSLSQTITVSSAKLDTTSLIVNQKTR